jgi:hypothetical protein
MYVGLQFVFQKFPKKQKFTSVRSGDLGDHRISPP